MSRSFGLAPVFAADGRLALAERGGIEPQPPKGPHRLATGLAPARDSRSVAEGKGVEPSRLITVVRFSKPVADHPALPSNCAAVLGDLAAAPSRRGRAQEPCARAVLDMSVNPTRRASSAPEVCHPVALAASRYGFHCSGIAVVAYMIGCVIGRILGRCGWKCIVMPASFGVRFRLRELQL